MEALVVKAKLDFKTYYKLSLRMHYGARTLISIAIALAAILIYFLLSDNADWVIEAATVATLVLIFGVLKPVRIWYYSKKLMRTSPILIEGITYYITNDSIEGIAPESSAKTNWKLIKKAVEKENYFLLLSEGMMFRYLPKSGFTSTGDIDKFKEIVKANNIKANFK